MQPSFKLSFALLASLGPAAAYAVDCRPLAQWSASAIYVGGNQVQSANKAYRANWWNTNADPATHSGPWQEWSLVGNCDGGGTNQPPTAALTSPANGASFAVGSTVTLAATASDPDGSVAKVEFYLDGTKLGEDTSSPYSLAWTAVAGSHTIYVKAIDDKGASTSTGTISINVVANNQPPVVSLSSPANGASFAAGSNVTLAANASDPDGSVAKVEFYLDGNKFGEDTTAPYSLNWTAVTGSHTVYAKAVDDKGAATSSTTASITVLGGGNQPPTVNVTSPVAGGSYTTGATLTLSANAADSDGSVQNVAFYLNGSLLATDNTAPYSVTWTATAGNHQLVARATDNQGLATDSAAIGFKVGDSGPVSCRPDGLMASPGTKSPYCTVYDASGREKMGADHPRRIIGYFTSWRHGKDGTPAFLVKDIPWTKLTHINFAFAHVDSQHRISVGSESDPNNAAVGMSWPGVPGAELDPNLPYKGHFNLLTRYKRTYPNVKTLISVGGWAETGGYFDEQGRRVNSGGFYTMTTNADNSVNQAGINTFADSVVAFLRRYGFDGVDIDYEYPTSMNNAGNPDDFTIANARRAGLMRSYQALMQTLRAKLDAAGEADGKHYLTTAAVPASGYLLRGMEAFQVTDYFDFINVMSYDLHGAWNQFVGPNAALFDTGQDNELIAWNYYSAPQYARIGYLNTDWAYHYYRGAMPAGRINIGLPYYTRGWRNVVGGTNGLWGKAAMPDQSKCPPGTGGSETNKCGDGAVGIDNLWHDLGVGGKEVAGGGNPMWHAKNLQDGRAGSYIGLYGLDPVNDPDDRLTGTYTRYYDSTATAPWLWNASKRVFLSTEDEQSVGAKADYVASRGIGGVMFWELAGDYRWNATRGEYFIGDTLTTLLYDRLKTAAPYNATRAGTRTLPTQAVDVRFAISGFALGDSNYPINPKLTLTNKTGKTIAGGTEFNFDVPTAIPASIADQSGFGLKVIEDGSNSAGHNIGGLQKDFHRVSVKLPSWQTLADGQSVTIALNYYLPMPLPSNWTIQIGSNKYALVQEHPELPVAP